jgi:hypothetical protein
MTFHQRIAIETADHLNLLGFDAAAVRTIAADHSGETLLSVTDTVRVDPDEARQYARDRLSAIVSLPQPDLANVLDLVVTELARSC